MSATTLTAANPLTAARLAIAEAAAMAGWNVYSTPPEVATLPLLIISPGDPWAAPLTWTRTEVALLVTAGVTQAGSTDAAMTGLEQALWDLFAALRAIGAVAGEVSQPRQITFGQAQALCADMRVRLHVDDDPTGE